MGTVGGRMASWGPPDQSTCTSQHEARVGRRGIGGGLLCEGFHHTTGPCIVKRPPIDGEGAASRGSKANSLRPSLGCRCACHNLRMLALCSPLKQLQGAAAARAVPVGPHAA